MIEVKSRRQGNAAVLYDARRATGFAEAWLGEDGSRRAGQRLTGGRGAVELIAPLGEAWVLRHYRRGGWMAKLFKDVYLWRGAERTRCFREFRLLAELVEAGLPVAPPVAARCRREGLVYRADLVTVQLPEAQTLAEAVLAGQLDPALAAATGHLIARFHRAGIWHADLNAHNILHSRGQLYLIDFDRGERRRPAPRWQQANLQRLRRSLLKLGAGRRQPADWDGLWQVLVAAYQENLRA